MRTLLPIALMGNNHEVLNHEVLVAETLRARIPREVLLERLREAAIKALGAPVDPDVPLLAQWPKLIIRMILPATTIMIIVSLLIAILLLRLTVAREPIATIRLRRDKYAGCPPLTIVGDPLAPPRLMVLMFQQ